MKIKELRIRNFKSIGNEEQVIVFAPITMLFGANSVGKSTVIQALIYLYEIICNRNLDPDKTSLGGDSIDLGGFKNLVHMRDLGNDIQLGLRFEIETDQLKSYASEFERTTIEEAELYDAKAFLDIVLDISINLSLAWSHTLNKVIVNKTELIYHNDQYATIMAPEREYEPKPEEIFLISSSQDGREIELSGNPFEVYPIEIRSREPGKNDFRELIESLISDNVQRRGSQREGSFLPLILAEQNDALPNFTTRLIFSPLTWRDDVYHTERDIACLNFVHSIFNITICGSLSVLADWLEQIIYIGPLRQVPSRAIEQPRKTASVPRWSNGLAAWELLHTLGHDDETIKKINNWMGEEALDTGYSLSVSFRREVDDWDISFFDDKNNLEDFEEDDLNFLHEILDEGATKSKVSLIEERFGFEVSPTDIGIGISQLFPIIIAAFETRGLVAIEQPELHIHPRLQTELADLFIAASKTHAQPFLLETHSEHLILRLLRRIRENSSSPDSDVEKRLAPSEIAINYVESSDSGAKITQLHVNADGDFDNEWPGGFFEERDQELYF